MVILMRRVIHGWPGRMTKSARAPVAQVLALTLTLYPKRTTNMVSLCRAPHPDPLPTGEGAASPVEGAGSDRRPFSAERTGPPLPAGEGRGEGPLMWCDVGCFRRPYSKLQRNPLLRDVSPAKPPRRQEGHHVASDPWRLCGLAGAKGPSRDATSSCSSAPQAGVGGASSP